MIHPCGQTLTRVYYYDGVTGYVAKQAEAPVLPGHTIEYRYAPDSRELSSLLLDRVTVQYTRDTEHRVTQVEYLLNDEHRKPSATPMMHWAAAARRRWPTASRSAMRGMRRAS